MTDTPTPKAAPNPPAKRDADPDYEKALAAIRHLSDEKSRLSVEERREVDDLLNAIAEFEIKLDNNEFSIAAFGEVNTGKSRLLNALLGQDVFKFAAVAGETKDARGAGWTPEASTYKEEGLSDHKLFVIDTPGLNEWNGEDRERIAKETVRYADIVLYVVAGDLRDSELQALRWLDSFNKPIILVLNKIDTMRPNEVDEAEASIRAKTAGLIAPESIIRAAGAPREMEVIVREADGTSRREKHAPAPLIDDLKVRILSVVAREGKAIAALNASLFADDTSGRIAEMRAEFRGAAAQKVIRNHMLMKALAVGANPVPLADLAAAFGIDAHMIRQLGLVHGHKVTVDTARRLARDIIGAGAIIFAAEWGTHMLASVAKLATVGSTTILTSIPQALAGAWSSYILGQATALYFRQGGWGSETPKEVIKRILRETDKDSVLKPLEARLREGKLLEREKMIDSHSHKS
ncbi:MAG: DUF697 domain-containing protein [Pseudomonadota bacterium]